MTPIGGISGLVSRTGQGILSRGHCSSKASLDLDSRQQLSTRFLKELKNMEIFTFIKCEDSEAVPCWLVLTKEVLVLYDEQNFSQVFSWNVSLFIGKIQKFLILFSSLKISAGEGMV